MNKRICCLSALVVIGAIFVIAGVVFVPVSKNLIHNEIEKQITLNSTDTYNHWVKNPTPIFFEVYMWNLMNPEDVQAGEKPSLEQMGPYVYQEHRQKVGVKFHDNNGTVTYREDKYYVFDREKSIGPETDNFTSVNIILMLAANVLKKEFSIIQIAAQFLLDWANEDLFRNYTVKELIWGYQEPLINKTLTLLEKYLGKKFNISDEFGIFVGTNGTDDGVYNIKTGQGDTSLFGQIEHWNYVGTLNYWTTPTCNMINGTDGTIFHPFTKKSDVLYVFSTDLCRSIYFTYLKDGSQKDIDVYRFTVPKEVFMNPYDNPANQGYCTPADNCLPSGLLNMENCHTGAPIVFSQPHFLNADDSVIHGVAGMHPSLAEHSTFIDIEPNTGAAFFAAKKLQVNIQLEKVDNIKATEKLRKVVMPVMWLNEHSEITDDLADQFKSQLKAPMTAIHAGIYVAIIVGGLMVLLAIAFVVVTKIKNRNKYMKMDSLAE